MPKLSGQCLCGNIAFSTDTEILRAANCHCADCRGATGAAFATLLTVDEDALTITGTPKAYGHKADSGADMEKLFCPDCGSQMFARNSNRPGTLSIRAGVIEQTDEVKPAFNLFGDSKIASTPLDPDLPLFDRMPG
ncbi:MAG: aldehyde-activating protein [Alphaproteobacteria bacterium]|nr:aldehyde-activating protein [Alphaproteobacteria bacterium]